MNLPPIVAKLALHPEKLRDNHNEAVAALAKLLQPLSMEQRHRRVSECYALALCNPFDEEGDSQELICMRCVIQANKFGTPPA